MPNSGGVKDSHPLSTTETGDIHKPFEPSWHRKKDITEINNRIHQVNLFSLIFSLFLGTKIQIESLSFILLTKQSYMQYFDPYVLT